MSIGTTITEYRKKLGLTQDALAQRLGVTNQAVSKWELDQCCPDIGLLPKLADVFDISLDALFGREEKEKIVKTDLPWDDDNTLRVVLYVGHTLVDGHKNAKEFTFNYEGPALNVYSHINVCCGDVQGDVDAGCDVNCGDVNGNVDAGCDVNCGNVEGNADAGCDVNCGDVMGDVDAGVSVTCGSVQGDVEAGVSVHVETGGHQKTGSEGTYVFQGEGPGAPSFVKDMLSGIFGKKEDK